MQSRKKTASTATIFNVFAQEYKPTFNLNDAISQPLPAALVDKCDDLSFKQSFYKLRNVQHLSQSLKSQMAFACEHGDLTKIHELCNINTSFLLMPPSQGEWTPLHYALENEKSLVCIVDLLEEHLPGLALMGLMQPDQSHRLPLENALHYSGLGVIQKLMAWMGDDKLINFRLTGPLPKYRQTVLNNLLLICILREKVEWAKKTIFWGAHLPFVVNDQYLLIDAPDKAVNKKILYELYTLWHAMDDPFPSLEEQVQSDLETEDEDVSENAFSEQKFNVNGGGSQFFPSVPDKQKDSSEEAMELMQAIYEGRDSDVRELLAQKILAFAAIETSCLNGLPPEFNQRPVLTALQYADRLNRTSICRIIMDVLGDELAAVQLGHERVASLKAPMQHPQQRMGH